MPTTSTIEIKIKKDGEIEKVADLAVKVGNAVRWKAPAGYRLHVLFSGASPAAGKSHVSANDGAMSEDLRPEEGARFKAFPYIVLLYNEREDEWKVYPSTTFGTAHPVIPPPRITVPGGTIE